MFYWHFIRSESLFVLSWLWILLISIELDADSLLLDTRSALSGDTGGKRGRNKEKIWKYGGSIKNNEKCSYLVAVCKWVHHELTHCLRAEQLCFGAVWNSSNGLNANSVYFSCIYEIEEAFASKIWKMEFEIFLPPTVLRFVEDLWRVAEGSSFYSARFT